eukprot:4293870-Ditylum_brightwellii.AAC.1
MDRFSKVLAIKRNVLNYRTCPKEEKRKTLQRCKKVSDSTLDPVDGQLSCHLDIVNYTHLPRQKEKAAPAL